MEPHERRLWRKLEREIVAYAKSSYWAGFTAGMLVAWAIFLVIAFIAGNHQ